jgi:ribokinase
MASQRVPAEIGDIETQLAHDFVRLSGGKAANRAYLARRFGHPVQLFGRVGDDELARQALEPLASDGVDLAGVSAAAGAATAVSIIVVPPSAKKRIFLASNANARWDAAAADALEAAVTRADAGSVLTVDYEAAPAEVVTRALQAAGRRGIRVIVDPSPGHRMDGSSMRLCAAMAPNEEEAKALTGIKVADS